MATITAAVALHGGAGRPRTVLLFLAPAFGGLAYRPGGVIVLGGLMAAADMALLLLAPTAPSRPNGADPWRSRAAALYERLDSALAAPGPHTPCWWSTSTGQAGQRHPRPRGSRSGPGSLCPRHLRHLRQCPARGRGRPPGRRRARRAAAPHPAARSHPGRRRRPRAIAAAGARWGVTATIGVATHHGPTVARPCSQPSAAPCTPPSAPVATTSAPPSPTRRPTSGPTARSGRRPASDASAAERSRPLPDC